MSPSNAPNRAMAIYVMGGPAGVIAAGIVGGLLTDAFGWRVALYALGAVSLVVALFAAFVLPEPKRKLPQAAASDNGGYLVLTRKQRHA